MRRHLIVVAGVLVLAVAGCSETDEPARVASTQPAEPTTTLRVPSPDPRATLTSTGIGDVPFGTPYTEAVARLEDLFGPVEEDSGWHVWCEPAGSHYTGRILRWGSLSVIIDSDYDPWVHAPEWASEGDEWPPPYDLADDYPAEFVGYGYGTGWLARNSDGDLDDPSLATADGLGLGDSRADVESALPVSEFTDYYPGLLVEDDDGTLTFELTDEHGVVVSIAAGAHCGD